MENTEIKTTRADEEFTLSPLEYRVIGDPDGEYCVEAVFGIFDLLREFMSKPAGHFRLSPEQRTLLELLDSYGWMGETSEFVDN